MKPRATSSRWIPLLAACSLVAVSGIAGLPLRAEEPEQPRVAAARLLSPTGTIVRRVSPETPWQPVKQNEEMQTGDLFVCAGDTVAESVNKAVRISLINDLDGRVSGTSPFPIIETAAIFHPAEMKDLVLTLDRGRLLLTNTKEKGSAKVRVLAAGEAWDLTLLAPGSSVAVETFGRWSCTCKFKKNPEPGYGPCQDVVLLVVKGEADLKHRGTQLALSAPPGPAYVQWEKGATGFIRPQRLEKLPQWTKEAGPAAVVKKDPEAIRRFRAVVLAKGLDAGLDEFLHSEKPEERALGIYAAAALDDLPRLGMVLRQSRDPDLWENAVLALRHWIGRKPGQDQKLYNGLVKSGRLTPVEAEIVMNLLHSFDDPDLEQPETYELLIEYLRNDKLPIRGLAHWHLVRLVPEGKKIPYHPLDSEEKRLEGYRKWKELVPSGKLPTNKPLKED